MHRTFGWRHFHVAQKRREGREVFLRLVATCDETVQLWVWQMQGLGLSFALLLLLTSARLVQVNAKTLRDQASWAPGNLQRTQLEHIQSGGAECKACGGTGRRECPLCCSTAGLIRL